MRWSPSPRRATARSRPPRRAPGPPSATARRAAEPRPRPRLYFPPPPGETPRPMGRIFETRKATMFARWDRMSKAFSRIGKEITIAVRAGGPSPENNPALRRVIQNARAVNMPKDKVEAAIKRASGQGAEAFEEVLYEGYAPHGVALLIEAATDNPVRTVGNLRSYFNKHGGNLASNGSVSFQFKHMGVFRL